MFKLKVHLKCTRLAHLIYRNILYLNVFMAPNRCVWCGAALGQLQTLYVHLNADASQDTSPDATLFVNGKREGRSHLSNAKRRATGMLMQGFISLMSNTH